MNSVISADVLIASFTAWLSILLLVPLLQPIAWRVGLIDRPAGRKAHVGDIPMTGGLAIFVAYVIALVVSGNFALWGWVLLLIWGSIVVLGLWNDIRHIPVVIRVVVQVMAIIALCAYSDIHLKSLGDLLGNGPQGLGRFALPLTILGLIGVKNGINLIDGLDGLAGTQVLSSLFWFALLSIEMGRADLVLTVMPLAGAVLGFLAFNLRLPGRPATVFLGDHGSVFLGFTLAWIAVVGSQGAHSAFTPIEAVWILGIPILDTIRVMLSRMIRGVNPFVAGRDHLHYLLVDSGMSVNATVLLLLLGALFFGAVVWFGRMLNLSDVFLLCAFLGVSVFFFLGAQYLDLKLIRGRSASFKPHYWQ